MRAGRRRCLRRGRRGRGSRPVPACCGLRRNRRGACRRGLSRLCRCRRHCRRRRSVARRGSGRRCRSRRRRCDRGAGRRCGLRRRGRSCRTRHCRRRSRRGSRRGLRGGRRRRRRCRGCGRPRSRRRCRVRQLDDDRFVFGFGAQRHRLLKFDNDRTPIRCDAGRFDHARQLRRETGEIAFERPGKGDDEAVVDALGGVADRRRPIEGDTRPAAQGLAGDGNGIRPRSARDPERQEHRDPGSLCEPPHRGSSRVGRSAKEIGAPPMPAITTGSPT